MKHEIKFVEGELHVTIKARGELDQALLREIFSLDRLPLVVMAYAFKTDDTEKPVDLARFLNELDFWDASTPDGRPTPETTWERNSDLKARLRDAVDRSRPTDEEATATRH